jgi:hypothetical protein
VNDTTCLSLPDRFISLVEGLMNHVEAEIHLSWVPIPLIKLFWRRLRRMKARLVSIMARYHAGTLPPPRSARRDPTPDPPAAAPDPPADAPDPADAPSPPPAPPPLALPRYPGWVVRTIAGTLLRRFELEGILEDPATPAQVAELPQLGGMLRAMCRMLRAEVPRWLRLPRRPRKPRPSRRRVIPPAPDWAVNAPGAIIKPDGSVWQRWGASTHWRPGCGQTLEEAQKFDYPRRIWPPWT